MNSAIMKGVLLCLTLMLAACATPYSKKSIAHGYHEEVVDPSSYRVSFVGNGNTTKGMVMNYWIYRCAELTLEKGFDIFVVLPKEKATLGENENGWQAAGYTDDQPPTMLKTRGGRAVVPVFIPGAVITSYRADGVIQMFWEPMPREVEFGLKARVVVDMLKPYVQSAGKTDPPSLAEIFKQAGMVPKETI